jgi:hypothetical protein
VSRHDFSHPRPRSGQLAETTMSDEVQKLQDRRLVLAISNEIVGDDIECAARLLREYVDARGPIMSDTNKPAMPLDDLPRPGVAIPLQRWLDLLAIEQKCAKQAEEIARLREALEDSSIAALKNSRFATGRST